MGKLTRSRGVTSRSHMTFHTDAEPRSLCGYNAWLAIRPCSMLRTGALIHCSETSYWTKSEYILLMVSIITILITVICSIA